MPLVQSSRSRQCFVCSGAPKPSCYRKGHVKLCPACKSMYSGSREDCPYCNPAIDKFRPTMKIKDSENPKPGVNNKLNVTAKMVFADGPDRTMNIEDVKTEMPGPSDAVVETVEEAVQVPLPDEEPAHDETEGPVDEPVVSSPVEEAPVEPSSEEELCEEEPTFEKPTVGEAPAEGAPLEQSSEEASEEHPVQVVPTKDLSEEESVEEVAFEEGAIEEEAIEEEGTEEPTIEQAPVEEAPVEPASEESSEEYPVEEAPELSAAELSPDEMSSAELTSPGLSTIVASPALASPTEASFAEEALVKPTLSEEALDEKLSQLSLETSEPETSPETIREPTPEPEPNANVAQLISDTDDEVPEFAKRLMEMNKKRAERQRGYQKPTQASQASSLPVKRVVTIKRPSSSRSSTPEPPSYRGCSVHGKLDTQGHAKKPPVPRASIARTNSARVQPQIKKDVEESKEEDLGECF